MLPNENKLKCRGLAALAKAIFLHFSLGIKVGNGVFANRYEEAIVEPSGTVGFEKFNQLRVYWDYSYPFNYEISCGFGVHLNSNSSDNFSG